MGGGRCYTKDTVGVEEQLFSRNSACVKNTLLLLFNYPLWL